MVRYRRRLLLCPPLTVSQSVSQSVSAPTTHLRAYHELYLDVRPRNRSCGLARRWPSHKIGAVKVAAQCAGVTSSLVVTFLAINVQITSCIILRHQPWHERNALICCV
jgi:hypothetical protein